MIIILLIFSLAVQQLAGSNDSTRISKQCKSFIDVLMHRQYLENFFVEKKKNREGREGKYSEKKNMLLAEEKKSREGKRGKY